jgi:hypothetical protein
VAEAQQAPEREVAPTHQDVRSTFSDLQIAICVSLGSVAIAAGIVLGIVIAND